MKPAKHISVAAHVASSDTNGPGVRFVLWVQGCPKRCRGCWNPEFLPFRPVDLMSVDAVYDLIRSKSRNFSSIGGVTFSGGEPFEQAAALAELAQRLRTQHLNTLAFTGYTIEEIRQRGGAMARFLESLDILVDGEYVEALSEQKIRRKLLWRGSANQRIHLLTEIKTPLEGHLEKIGEESGDFDIIINNGTITITGFPDPGFLASLSRQ